MIEKMKWILNYKNPVWEPCFYEISKPLAWMYFHMSVGVIRYAIASLIFKKLTWMEKQAGIW